MIAVASDLRFEVAAIRVTKVWKGSSGFDGSLRLWDLKLILTFQRHFDTPGWEPRNTLSRLL